MDDIEKRARQRRATGTRKPLGVRAILGHNPHHRPEALKRSPTPIAHAATLETWLAMKIAYREFAFVYREAARRLKRGLEATFPPGCFPPPASYIARAGPALA